MEVSPSELFGNAVKDDRLKELLNAYEESVASTGDDIKAAEEAAEAEAQGDFGLFDNIRKLYSSASLGNPVMPNYIYTSPNLQERIEVTKDLAAEQKVKFDDVDQKEVDDILKQNKKDRVLSSIRDSKTEEFIENLTEEDQKKLSGHFAYEVGTLSAKSKAKLLEGEKIANERDAIVNELEAEPNAVSPCQAKAINLYEEEEELFSFLVSSFSSSHSFSLLT